MRLRRSDLTRPGYGRRRSGKGFSYRDTGGGPLKDAAAVARIRELVIPPAWTDVWISTDPRGHIQATGVDAAGRKQYVYHPRWRTARDEKKFEHALEVAERLPEIRSRLCADLSGRGLTRDRVLAAITRLLDMGMFRVGSDQYAQRDEDPSFGLSTLRPEHVRTRGGCVVLEFVGKSGKEHATPVGDGEVCQVLRDLRRRRRGEERLFAWYDRSTRRWREIRADDVNDYLREISGHDMTAKDFRTWHGTVKAAGTLAQAGPQKSGTARRRAVSHAMKEVAELLGNTPAVARSSYVDPRVVEAYENGETVGEPTEEAVLDLLRD
ncbi:DNA topoisomerase [Actinoplanes sp. NBRC 14428]|uniref:DNA topoisomerase n=1 Tax=Pseudosporangium ferrugineum TaxID=439699 RepID=A0A2T0SFX6_9ACTN|nr:DNA topoisomerase IB [Pseudosporangium ferrugineum]PRY32263.1 DNA topoisomerase IB [Pseudosporangium ferrugineum]BCJ49484.1 DNA topoisomerase [Actinoplanes sp. NBRC 14428]